MADKAIEMIDPLLSNDDQNGLKVEDIV